MLTGEWVPVTSGESDTKVYRRGDGAAYAKVAPASGIDALRGERDRVAWLAGTGIPGAEVLEWSESGDGRACLVTSAVAGVAAVELPPDARPKAVERLAGMLRRLHDLDVAACPFVRPLGSVFGQAEDVVRRGAVNPQFLRDEWRRERPEDLLARLESELPYAEERAAGDLVVCHGDACLPNFLFDPDSLEITGLIDLGRLGVADRYADLALTAVQLVDEWDLDPAGFLTAYGLPDPDRRRLDVYMLLDPLTWG
ncbi:aminoglycoside 3'-phosphotransferase [Kribbella caucasensis]|uniref:aminoglycoside 3'-phosphotransferase n=1 Tax=Kribbella caucasensis TaxID=2512215 RepID=UPI0014151C5D|nr:aminoglycoside 3'-phosphotransferase [Kribbella sp. VKM Ac-2527]